MKKNPDNHTKLLAFMMGWKKGSGGLAFTETEEDDVDWREGFEHGRRAKRAAYLCACEKYGTELSPLRLQLEGNETAVPERVK